MATNLKRTTVFLTPEQHEGLRRLAFEQRTSMAKLLRDAALEILEDEEDIQQGLKALSVEEITHKNGSTPAASSGNLAPRR